MERSAVSEANSARQEMAEIPMSDLLALRDRVGTKEFSRVYHNQSLKRTHVAPERDRERPPEFSSKKRPRAKDKRRGGRGTARDPRFDERAGPYREDKFCQAYSFLEEVRATERCEVEREIKGAGKSEDTSQLRTLLDRMRAQERAREERARDREVARQWAKEERQRVGEGKGRFHLKKSSLRELQLESRLKVSGGKRAIDKRRKRLEKKSRKRIPQRRGEKGMHSVS